MKLRFKSKLLLLTLVPISIIIALSLGRILHDVKIQKALLQTKQKIIEAQKISNLIHFMQKERGYSAGYLGKFKDKQSTEYKQSFKYVDATFAKLDKHVLVNADFIKKLNNLRQDIQKHTLLPLQAIKRYTEHINTLFDYIDILTISAKEKKHKDLLQSYGYLSFAKEQIGRIRALLHNAFMSKSLSKESIYKIKEALYVYNKATQKFKNTLFENSHLLYEYKTTLNQKSIHEMFKIINKRINDTNELTSYDASAWFEIATTNIDLFKKLEDKLFKDLNVNIDTKIENSQNEILIIVMLLVLLLVFLAYFMHTIIKKILSSAYMLNEEFENSLVLLEQYKDTVDHSFIVSKTDSKGIITYVNNAFCEISGYTQDELLGKPHNIIRHPDMSKEIFKEMWQTIKEFKKPWIGDIKNLAKDGSNYWMRAFINPILDKEGNIIEYIAMRTDTTQIQEEKERIRDTLGIKNQDFEEARHLANEYEKAIDATWSVIRTDTKNTITYANKTFEKLSGYTKKELIGKNCSELRSKKHILHGDCQIIEQKLANKEIVHIEFENIGKDKQPCYMDTTIIPIENSNGEIIEHLHLMCNITELIKLHQEIEETQQEIIFKMGEIGESRNKETGHHVKRVAKYSKLLAIKAGLSEKEANVIEAASPMHDIGKVAIPDAILLKPGSFEPHEWEIMKSHSEIGYKVLKGSQRELLKASAIIAHEHHEKYNGSGYPRGINAENIHIYGRIVAIADVFDALGSDRIYKKGWELEKIVKFFKEERGRSFDPRLLDIFLENLDEFLEIKEKYGDTKLNKKESNE